MAVLYLAINISVNLYDIRSCLFPYISVTISIAIWKVSTNSQCLDTGHVLAWSCRSCIQKGWGGLLVIESYS